MSISNIILNLVVNGNNQARQQLNELTVSVTALSATFTALGKVVFDVSREFNKSLTNLQSITNITDAQVKKLGDSIKELSGLKDVADTALEISNAVNELAGNGFDNLTTSMKIATIAGQAAAAGNVKTADSVRLLSGIMNSYNTKSAKDAAEISDKLFTIVGRGSVKFEALANNMSQLLPIASSSGIKMDELGGAIIRMSQTSMPMAQIETGLAGLIRQLGAASPDIKKFAKTIGVDLSEEALQKGLVPMLEQLDKATGGSKELIKKLIPDTEGANAAMVLMANGAKLLKTEVAAMGDGVGASTKALEIQTKSYAFQVSKLNSDLENLKITFGDIVNKALVPFIEKTREVIKFISNLDDSTKEMIVKVGMFTAGVGALGLALGGLALAFTPVVSGLSLVFKGVGSLYGSFIALSGILGTGGAFGVAVVAAMATVWSLKKIIDGVKEAFNTIDAIASAKTVNVENEKTLKNALQLAQAYTRLSIEQKKALNVDELREYSKAFAILAGNSTDKAAKERNRNLGISLSNQAKELEKTESIQRKVDEQNKINTIKNAKEKARIAEENARIAEENAKKQEDIDKENKRKLKQSEEDYKQLQIRLADDVLKHKLSNLDYELKQVELKRDANLKLAKNQSDRDKINFVYQKERNKILDDYKKEQQQKEQELANKIQKINDEITKYVEDETKKRIEIEKKNKEESEKIALEIYQYKKKQDKEALDEELKLGEEESKALEEQTKEFIENDSNSLDERLDLLNKFVEYKKIKYDEDSKEYKEVLKKQTDWQKQLRDDEIKSIESFYSEIAAGAVNLGNSLGNSTDSLTNFVGSLIESAGRGFNSFLNMSNQLSNIQDKLKKGDITDVSAKFQTMALGVQSAVEVVAKSIDAIVSNYNKQQQVTVKIERAISNFGANSKESKDAILEANESISDSFKALPGILGEPLSKLARMFTDFLGLTKSVAQQAKEEAFNQDLMKAIKSLNKVFDDLDKAEQLRIDMIDDEMTKRSEQLAFDIKIIQKGQESEFLKIAMIQKKYYDFNKWKQEQQSKDVKTVDDSGKKIQEINEKNYKSELSIIDEVYGKKRKKLESEVQKEIDIIQSKNDRIKAIEDERTQSDTDKQKRLQAFNQSLANSSRTADFYRANEQDFEFGFNGISNERKKIEADYNAGIINYETYAKKRTEIGLKQYQYYNEQTKRISDPKAKQEALDKATQGQEEYYNFIFDKEKEKVENETKQAEKRLANKKEELATVTELEKSEIAKLDEAYKDKAGFYKDKFVEATQVWTKFAQESINNIDLSNLINKVKNDVAQAKAELNGITPTAKNTVQQAKTISDTFSVPTVPTPTPVNTSTPNKTLSGVSKGISSVASGISNAASSIAKGINSVAIPYGPTAPDWYNKYTFATNPIETTVKTPDNPNVSDYELKRRKQHEDQAKINKLIPQLISNPNFGFSFDNYINQSLDWFENQARRLGIPLMAKGGVTNGLSIAGEKGSEAIFNYSDMKSMYDFVKNTAINPSNNYSNQASININYSPVFTGIDLSKTGQVDALIKNNMNTLKNDILKAQAGR